jgi:hypothetical protein
LLLYRFVKDEILLSNESAGIDEGERKVETGDELVVSITGNTGLILHYRFATPREGVEKG